MGKRKATHISEQSPSNAIATLDKFLTKAAVDLDGRIEVMEKRLAKDCNNQESGIATDRALDRAIPLAIDLTVSEPNVITLQAIVHASDTTDLPIAPDENVGGALGGWSRWLKPKITYFMIYPVMNQW